MKMKAGIALELLPAFRWNSGGISVSSRWNSSENAGRNSAGIFAGIPPEYQRENGGRNSARIESDFWSRVKGKLSRVRVVCRG